MGPTRDLLKEVPEGTDLHEFRDLLNLRIGGPGQYDGDSIRHLYLPQAREACRLVLVYQKKSLSTLQRIEPGPAFDEKQWQQILDEARRSLLSGRNVVGRDYCFSGRRVTGSWRGAKSGVQILPAPPSVPLSPAETGQHPFILECPMRETSEWVLTNNRRLKTVRTTAMLLNVLLNVSIRPHWVTQPDHLWVSVPGTDCRRFKFDWLRRLFRRPPVPTPEPRIEWGQEFFFAPLDAIVLDDLSPPAANEIEVVDSGIYRAGR